MELGSVRRLGATWWGRRVGRRGTTVVALAALLVAGGCSEGLRDAATTSASATEVSLLYSVVAPSLVVAVEGDGFRISMPATSSTAWFTDRPDRMAGNMSVADLVSLWEAEGFVDDPPNAAVVVTVDGAQHQHVVELTDPRIGPDGTVSFHAVDIGDDETTDAVAGRDATHAVVIGTFGESELFIDDGTTAPCPTQVTRNWTTCALAANRAVSFNVEFPGSSAGIVVIQASGSGTRSGSVTGYRCSTKWTTGTRMTTAIPYLMSFMSIRTDSSGPVIIEVETPPGTVNQNC